MLRTIRFSLVAIGLGFMLTAVNAPVSGQAKKKSPAGPAVELTEKSGKWGVWLLKPGTKILSDRDYAITTVPKEMGGSTFLLRTSGEYGRWLPDGTLKAKNPVTAYAMVRTKYNGNITFDQDKQESLVKDGWVEVEGKVGTTSPGKEDWQWKAFKKDIEAGDVSLPLKSLSWEKHGTAVVFFFKEREAK